MAERRQYHVVPETDGWKLEDDSDVVGRYCTKESAIAAGRAAARANRPSRLVVHKYFGRVETEHTYPHGPVTSAG
ncbi:DUF2188 domain-containing protein [Micromonospora sp. WMMD1102]|uniref:DUF2188 domain-containing protein n=1 Tax=Micromonospora sp. WMMD1102 TaxID=3016105 RepID=UPI0024155028|nr:DUF2188 domain-containing protein [Micromonospora sp. WMMD1102]MDG4786705.1 DUF2188 domain-containing protein [Micromonospora sp. WMMD1102]